MVTTVYLHPRRTLIASWSTDSEVPVLVDYRELEAMAHPATLLELQDRPSAVVLSSGWYIHGFPCSSPYPDHQRNSFELEHICGIDADALPQVDLECSIPTVGGAYWRTLTCVDSGLVQQLRGILGPGCRIMSDVRADINAALSSVPPQSDPWMMFGRRGEQMITAVIGTNHRAELISTQPVQDGLPLQDAILAELALLRQRHGVNINHVLLFGDHLTVGMFETLKPLLRQASVKTARLQPFRNVSSEVDGDAERRIIARAHVVAPVMAALFTDM